MKREKMSSLAVLLLFAILATCALAVTAAGAGAYARLTKRDDAAYYVRTAEGYLTTRVRSAQRVSLEELQNTRALTIWEDGFVTQIYTHEGWLWELYHVPDSGLGLSDGEKLLPMQQLEAAMENGLLTLALTMPDGTERVLHLALGGEAAP